ncbi:MAG: chromosome segregation protein SMC [Thermoplasmata archaeon]|nr:MAG: chromosome segregation protein SMC [Thermoplasmata archaeon]
MYLKEIELENFKSFGRRLSIPLLKGYTAITGPNGSGKSNISDAILFVLGPKSSKVIRAGKLTDLIFNGGKSRKAAKFCRVSLVFDNEDRVIPHDSDEVRLTRVVRVSQSVKDGYNSYFYVNGRPSQAMEFENLLAHARISAEGYNLIQKGDINKITQMSPLDVRRMLDDVAGITKFDKDIGKAENKRSQVEENLERIGILTDEIERRLKTLDKDRSDALKSKELEEKIINYKSQLAMKKKGKFELEIQNLQERISKLEQENVETEEKIEELKRKQSETESQLSEVDNKLAELAGDEAKDLKEKIEEVRLAKFRAKDTQDNAQNDIQDYKREKAAINSDLKTAQKELKNYENTLDNVKKELTKKKTKKGEVKTELKELEDLASKSDTEILNMRREITKLGQKLEAARGEVHQKTLEKERMEERFKRAEAEITETEELIKKYEFEIQEYDWHAKELTKDKDEVESVATIEAKLRDAHKQEQKLLKQSADLEEVIKNLSRELAQAKMQADAAEQVQKGYNYAVKCVLDARDDGRLKGIHGTIAELGNVNEKYNTALITAAGPRMQSIVVENDESAAKAINFLKKNKIGRASFLPLNKMVKGKPSARALMAVEDEKAVGFAIDLVEFDSKFASAFWYVFGDTVVAKDLDAARKLMGGVRLVTLDGELIEQAGAMVGGMAPHKTLKFGIPPDSEIDKIRTNLQKATEHSDKIAGELTDLKSEIIELENKQRNASIQEETKAQKVVEFETEKKLINEKLTATNKSYKEKCKDLDALKAELVKSEKEIIKQSEQLSEMETDREGKHQLMLKATSQEMAERINECRNELVNTKSDINELTSQEKTLETHIKLYEDKCEKCINSINEIENKVQESRNRIDDAKKTARDFEGELNKLMKVEQTMTKDQQKLSDERDKLMTRSMKLSNEHDKFQTTVTTNNDVIVSIGVQIQDKNKDLAEVMAEVQNYNINIDEFEEDSTPIDELKKLVPKYESMLSNIGPVNQRAIEEYNSENERLEKLKEEVSELEMQRDNLNELVEELKTKKKDGLMEVFTAVNENFKVIFAELSNGGTAELVLENTKDPFEGGLIIRARPKNKKMLRLDALSGGEKSLTALALIFSIQRYQPSPFYVLDEIDMFLDAINAEMVGKMITKNTKLAQFILISLRKVTFKDASHVYGVTMQGTGISYIVGKVNLTEIGEDGEIMKNLDDIGGPPPKELPEATGG